MSKDALPLTVADITPFARALSKQLRAADETPSHLTLLNMLARAAGFRNHQHLRASTAAKARLEAVPMQSVDFGRVEKTLNQFDGNGLLIRWPSKRYVQELALWVLWSKLPADQTLYERDVNGVLNHAHLFDDAALLRRSLIGLGLLKRKLDGSDYRRVERKPPAEAVALIREIAKRSG